MNAMAQDVKKAAYKYVFSRTWAPPYDLEAVMAEAEESFIKGARWFQDEKMSPLKQEIHAGLAVIDFFEQSGDKDRALEAARELLLKTVSL